ncbi:Cell wall alpha-1,3-glucan synthase ags1 [Entophlyctis luteolus]|nr:Cell wall alpha-1,3-glucan synthase ags1 [Entophlyctis luteolus]
MPALPLPLAMAVFVAVLCLLPACAAAPYSASLLDRNLNMNVQAADAAQYSAVWSGHSYTPSPANWRALPIYVVFIDRFSDGDPSNNNLANSSSDRSPSDVFEVNYRHGGDFRGLASKLDYLYALGIRTILMAGTPFLSDAWHGYNPLDFSLLEEHLGLLADFREMINAIHSRGMYFMVDVTLTTLANNLVFEGYPAASAPFNINGYRATYRTSFQYNDFYINNTWNPDCEFPIVWGKNGYREIIAPPDEPGCYDSDFNQFGDVNSTTNVLQSQRYFGRFGSVQDHIKDWIPRNQQRISALTCLLINGLATAIADIDGLRVDKGSQFSPAFYTVWGPKVHVSTDNFSWIVSEMTTIEIPKSAVFFGRGKQPNQMALNRTMWYEEQAQNNTSMAPLNSANKPQPYIYSTGMEMVDSSSFHYPVYYAIIAALLTDPFNADVLGAYYQSVYSDDLVNANTGNLDVRHIFGVSNPDLVRWPMIDNGIGPGRIGEFLTMILLTGVPSVYYGEEQQLSIVDGSGDPGYIFGRQAMSASVAWQLHGCLLDKNYYNLTLPTGTFLSDAAMDGCNNENVSADHFDPSHPAFVYLSHLMWLRSVYPVLVDGLNMTMIQRLNLTASDAEEPIGVLVGLEKKYDPLQVATGSNDSSAVFWMMYSTANVSASVNSGNCSILSPFSAGTTVKNIIPPYDTITISGSADGFGCISSMDMPAWFFGAYVEQASFVQPPPAVVEFSPGHDSRILYNPSSGTTQSVPLSLLFSSTAISCTAVTSALYISSSTGSSGTVDTSSAQCGAVQEYQVDDYVGSATGVWQWTGSVLLSEGVHVISINNTGIGLKAPISFMLRVGKANNPIVFGGSSLYDPSLIQYIDGVLSLVHAATGADQFQVSYDLGRNFGNWSDYEPVTPLNVTEFENGRVAVVVKYWSSMTGSSAHLVYSEYGIGAGMRPTFGSSIQLRGQFNEFGDDVYVLSNMQYSGGVWTFPVIPNDTSVELFFSVDGSAEYGDFDNNGILDKQVSTSLSQYTITIPTPESGYVGWLIVLNDTSRSYKLYPQTTVVEMVFYYILFFFLPLGLGSLAFYMYKIYYKVKFVSGSNASFPEMALKSLNLATNAFDKEVVDDGRRLKILMGTLEYKIPAWNIKVQIGGLGVMANVFADHYGKTADIIWVIPTVGDVNFPKAEEQNPIPVTIFDKVLMVQVSKYLRVDGVTYYICDCELFRMNTKADPYPTRMDDADSIAFYSAWNQCIAAIYARTSPDLLHIQDYHGAIAPLYLLPFTIPCAMSLHNAEFQGMWPCRNAEERESLASALNLSLEVLNKYLIMGTTANFVHAAAMYMKRHQKGYGVIGVSDSYASRVYKRYPALWVLQKGVGGINNPNPLDVGEFETNYSGLDPAVRAENKRLTQVWAGLDVDPNAQILVFIGRWSFQKGIDMIADLTPRIMKDYPDVQMICVGPPIDLYGKFAAIKLEKMMDLFPGRVCSKPQFTEIPPAVHMGCDFVLIPSRDEPFGLVAVEFGRKGVLGIGSLVGGLGSMPGWWYSVESAETKHLHKQFLSSIRQALRSSQEERARMREAAIEQRFGVEEWVRKTRLQHLEALAVAGKSQLPPAAVLSSAASGFLTSQGSVPSIDSLTSHSQPGSPAQSRSGSVISFARMQLGKASVPPLVLTPSQSASNMLEMGSSSVSSSHSATDAATPVSIRTRHRDSVASFGSFLKGGERSGEASVHGGGKSSLRLSVSAQSLHTNLILDDASEFLEQTLRDEDYYDSTVLEKANMVPLLTFDDVDGDLENKFKMLLDTKQMNPKTSVNELCIDNFLVKGKRKFYKVAWKDEYGRVENLVVKFVQYRIADWPVYTILLGIGQLIAASSYQIVLLTGNKTYSDLDFYVVGAVFLVGTLFWSAALRLTKSIYGLSIPFFIYAIAVFLTAFAGYSSKIAKFSIWVYTFASSSGPLFLFLNFGEDVGSFTFVWTARSIVIDGLRQFVSLGLWYFGSQITGTTSTIQAISFVASVVLALIGVVLAIGLPDFYRTDPPSIPFFMRQLLRRKLVVIYVTAIFLQNFFLSGPLGRVMTFLWSQGAVLSASLTRTHVGGALLLAQFFGAIGAMLARAFAPDSLGPGPVFPNISLHFGIGGWFWAVLVLQFAIALSLIFVYRFEQLSKP